MAVILHHQNIYDLFWWQDAVAMQWKDFYRSEFNITIQDLGYKAFKIELGKLIYDFF